MNDLVVVRFHGLKSAATVLSELLQLTYDGKLDLFDAVAAYRTDDGVLRIDESVQTTTTEGARWGLVFGGVLGATIAGPFTVGLSLAAAAAIAIAGVLGGGTIGARIGAHDASVAKQKYGIPDDFVRQVGGVIQPGDSAVFAILERRNSTVLEDTLRGYGGELIRTDLKPEAVQRGQDAPGG